MDEGEQNVCPSLPWAVWQFTYQPTLVPNFLVGIVIQQAFHVTRNGRVKGIISVHSRVEV
jgi:hypothetical protein